MLCTKMLRAQVPPCPPFTPNLGLKSLVSTGGIHFTEYLKQMSSDFHVPVP